MHLSHRWALALWIGLAPAAVWAQEQAYTRVPAVVYVAPDEQSNTLAQLNMNEPLWLYGCDEERAWCQISWNGVSGWVEGEALIRVQGVTTTYLQQYDQWPVPIIVIQHGGGYHSGYPHPHPRPPSGEGPPQGSWPPGLPHQGPPPPHQPPAPAGPRPGEKGYTGRPASSP